MTHPCRKQWTLQALGLSVVPLLLLGCAIPTPQRHFQVELNLELDENPYQVVYGWTCRAVLDGPNFGPGWILKEHWRINPEPQMVVKPLPDGGAIMFTAPWYCGEGAEYARLEAARIDKLIYIDSVDHPSIMEVYEGQRQVGTNHKLVIQGQAVTTTPESRDYEPTSEERAAKVALNKDFIAYQSLTARIYEDATLAKSKMAGAYFQRITELTVATPQATGVAGDRFVFFPVRQSDFLRAADRQVPLHPAGGLWTASNYDDPSHALIYYVQPHRPHEGMTGYPDIGRPPPVKVEYQGLQFEVSNSRQLYDPKRKLLIQFINSYQRYPWIGPQDF